MTTRGLLIVSYHRNQQLIHPQAVIFDFFAVHHMPSATRYGKQSYTTPRPLHIDAGRPHLYLRPYYYCAVCTIQRA